MLPKSGPAGTYFSQPLNAAKVNRSSHEHKQPMVLFCHDPTARPLRHGEETVRRPFLQVALTVIGHLCIPFVLRKSRWLASFPVIRFLPTPLAPRANVTRVAPETSNKSAELAAANWPLDALLPAGHP